MCFIFCFFCHYNTTIEHSTDPFTMYSPECLQVDVASSTRIKEEACEYVLSINHLIELGWVLGILFFFFNTTNRITKFSSWMGCFSSSKHLREKQKWNICSLFCCYPTIVCGPLPAVRHCV